MKSQAQGNMKIIIPGEPVSQARMKFKRIGSFVTTYDPKAKEKKKIRKDLEELTKLHALGYPRLSFLFQMPIPKSIPKRDLALYQSGLLKHDKKPDIDNLIKLYLDCLDGIVLHGDQKVSLGPCNKVYHPEPKTIIWINETKRTIEPLDLDVAFPAFSECDIPSFCGLDSQPDFESLLTRVRSLFLKSFSPDRKDQA